MASEDNDDVKDITNAIAASAERICAAITSSVGIIVLALGPGTEATQIVGAVLVFFGLIRATFTVRWSGFIS